MRKLTMTAMVLVSLSGWAVPASAGLCGGGAGFHPFRALFGGGHAAGYGGHSYGYSGYGYNQTGYGYGQAMYGYSQTTYGGYSSGACGPAGCNSSGQTVYRVPTTYYGASAQGSTCGPNGCPVPTYRPTTVVPTAPPVTVPTAAPTAEPTTYAAPPPPPNGGIVVPAR